MGELFEAGGLNRCPDFKGIETFLTWFILLANALLNRCPDFKGIETELKLFVEFEVKLNRCPDFKGIETSR